MRHVFHLHWFPVTLQNLLSIDVNVHYTADLLSGARIVQQIPTQETWNTTLGHLVLQTLGEENRDTTFGLQDIPWDGKERRNPTMPQRWQEESKPQKGLKNSQRHPLSWNPSLNRFVNFWARDAQGREWSLTRWHRRGQLQLRQCRCHWPVRVCRYQKRLKRLFVHKCMNRMNLFCCGRHNWQRPTRIVIACWSLKTHPTLCASFLSAA